MRKLIWCWESHDMSTKVFTANTLPLPYWDSVIVTTILKFNSSPSIVWGFLSKSCKRTYLIVGTTAGVNLSQPREVIVLKSVRLVSSLAWVTLLSLPLTLADRRRFQRSGKVGFLKLFLRKPHTSETSRLTIVLTMTSQSLRRTTNL